MNTLMKKTSLLTVATLMLAVSANAGDWANWRGPNYNGSSAETNLPTKFDKKTNVKWVVPMMGPSAATPIVVGDKVFVSTTNPGEKTLHALCLSRKDGSVIWAKQVGVGYQKDNRSNLASPSPVSDGKHVVFFYGNSDMACFTIDGKQLWKRNIEEDYGNFAFLWTFSSSPTLYEGLLFLPVLQRDTKVGRGSGGDSYILAIDPKTGKTVYKHVRPSKAKAESLEAFTTLIPYEYNGRKELLLAGGDCLTGHDPKTGKELWRWGTWNPRRIGHWRLVPSAVAGDGVVIACGPKGAPVFAVKAGAEGELERDGFLWESEDRNVSTDVSTPAYANGNFYVLNGERKSLTSVNAKTGKVNWTLTDLGSPRLRASPTVADGKIYFQNHAGYVWVVEEKTGKILHETMLGDDGDDMTRSSVVVSDGELFIRTNKALYCIGK